MSEVYWPLFKEVSKAHLNLKVYQICFQATHMSLTIEYLIIFSKDKLYLSIILD